MADPAFGANTVFAVDFETSWGVPKTVAKVGRKIGLVSNSVAGSRELQTNPTLRGDFNPAAPALGKKAAGGSMPHVLTPVTAPFIFESLFGNRTFTTDHHVSTLANNVSKSIVMEKGFTVGGVAKYSKAVGVRFNKVSIPINPDGFLQLGIDALAKDDTVSGTPYDSSYTDWTSDAPFTQSMLESNLKIGVGGGSITAVGYVRSGNIDIASNLFADDYRSGSDLARGSLVPQTFTVSGTLKVTLDTTAVLDLMTVAGTVCALDLTWTLAAGKTFNVYLPTFQFSKTTPTVAGPGPVDIDANFQAYIDPITGTSCRITTYNDKNNAYYA